MVPIIFIIGLHPPKAHQWWLPLEEGAWAIRLSLSRDSMGALRKEGRRSRKDVADVSSLF